MTEINKLPSGLVKILQDVKAVVILTGAGISAESGIPTFRDAQTGLWSKYRPEELATPQAFRANPQLVWDWYQWRRRLISRSEPNPGHFALARMENVVRAFTLITQNVDSLHKRAGSRNVIELHGDIMKNKCSNCHRPSKDQTDIQTQEIPRCPHCSGLLRPAVIWFGESLPQNTIQSAWDAAENCDTFFSIGTSALVQPAASLPVIAQNKGAVVIEINPTKTPLTQTATISIQGRSGEILPILVKQVWGDLLT